MSTETSKIDMEQLRIGVRKALADKPPQESPKLQKHRLPSPASRHSRGKMHKASKTR